MHHSFPVVVMVTHLIPSLLLSQRVTATLGGPPSPSATKATVSASVWKVSPVHAVTSVPVDTLEPSPTANAATSASPSGTASSVN